MSAEPSLTKILDRDWSLLIGGRPVPSADGRYYDDESPVTEEVIAAVPDADAADIGAAVDAAAPAAAAWRRVAARDRGAGPSWCRTHRASAPGSTGTWISPSPAPSTRRRAALTDRRGPRRPRLSAVTRHRPRASAISGSPACRRYRRFT